MPCCLLPSPLPHPHARCRRPTPHALPRSYGQLLSGEPLRINFHPSSLLSIGDLLAFMHELGAASAAAAANAAAASAPQQQQQQLALPAPPGRADTAASVCSTEEGSQMPGKLGSAAPAAAAAQGLRPAQQPAAAAQVQRTQQRRSAARTEAPPSIEEQMALADSLTSRIPQRCVASWGSTTSSSVTTRAPGSLGLRSLNQAPSEPLPCFVAAAGCRPLRRPRPMQVPDPEPDGQPPVVLVA